ncbi:kynurenine 3-monooxygenase [Klebsormidium nitens]|uniref:Kynurenine 3-monooxygenase n=1 Tax=Klebsormidium nitens TaxID=105231 RepID=A0A1Y1IJR4_KLENI|nr:kynurenine 3-monooxygenase [Klebsormidium nitens]|eukprot:GAQ88986.1 kynurenine 3-monooxygenase [Klebsormidium nitens]
MDVVIIGAGPSGLLLAHYLLEKGAGRFRISLNDAREDPRITIKRPPTARRYSIGISMRGRMALKGVDGLWEAIKARGVEIDHMNIFVMGRMIERPPANKGGQPVMTDRTSLCAAMLELLVQRHGKSGLLSLHFLHKCTGVDLDKRIVTFSDVQEHEDIHNGGLKMPGNKAPEKPSQSVATYDLLVGADGVRSVVRAAFMQHLRSFDYEQRDLGSELIIANIPPMPAVPRDVVVMIGGKKGGLGGLMLPSALSPDGETSMCLILKWADGARPAEWFAQKSAADAKRFLERTFPWLQIPEEAAGSLLTQRPSKSMQIKCSQYHDSDGAAVIMGDAAHASGPSIGQGVNTAFGDAAALASLLLKMGDPSELPAVLERFSALRVLEGHALVDLSESQNPASSATGTLNSVRVIIQGLLRRFFPKWFAGPIIAMAAGLKPLTEIYAIHKAAVDSVLEGNRKHRTALLERRHREKLQGLEALLPNGTASGHVAADPGLKKTA